MLVNFVAEVVNMHYATCNGYRRILTAVLDAGQPLHGREAGRFVLRAHQTALAP